MRILLTLVCMAWVAAASGDEYLIHRSADGGQEIWRGPLGLRIDHWDRLIPAEREQPEDIEQYGDIRPVGVETGVDEYGFIVTYTTTERVSRAYREIPYSVTTSWGGANWYVSGPEASDFSPKILYGESVDSTVRSTFQHTEPPLPTDGRIALNIIDMVTDPQGRYFRMEDEEGNIAALHFEHENANPVDGSFIGYLMTHGIPPGQDEVMLYPVIDFPSGDLNRDGQVNGLDVDPFVNVLLNGSYQVEADMNLNARVNGGDVASFIDVVTDGGVAGVPEPSTILLGFMAFIISGAILHRI